jgi:hypothetical protein
VDTGVSWSGVSVLPHRLPAGQAGTEREIRREEPMQQLSVPIPPMLEEVLGYRGTARFVAFSWEPASRDCLWADGRRRGIGSHSGYVGFFRHRAVVAGVEGHAVGSDCDATQWLVIDRRCRKLHVAPAEEARLFLRKQWCDSEAGPTLIASDVRAVIDVLRRPPTVELIAEGIRRQAEVQAEMMAWLDGVAAQVNGKHSTKEDNVA